MYYRYDFDIELHNKIKIIIKSQKWIIDENNVNSLSSSKMWLRRCIDEWFREHDQCTLRIIQSRVASTEVTNDNNSYSSSKIIAFEKYNWYIYKINLFYNEGSKSQLSLWTADRCLWLSANWLRYGKDPFHIFFELLLFHHT